MYYVYMLRCEDDSLYTGITVDIKRRMGEHFNRLTSCAKYTNSHHVKKLERVWQMDDRVTACRMEYYIKKLSKKKKEELICGTQEIDELLGDKLNIRDITSLEQENL